MVSSPFQDGNITSWDVDMQGRSAPSGSCSLSAGREIEPGSVVTKKQLLRRKGFSDQVVSTLLGSRKGETRSIYFKVWRLFNKWCRENSLNSYSLDSVLEFLRGGGN